MRGTGNISDKNIKVRNESIDPNQQDVDNANQAAGISESHMRTSPTPDQLGTHLPAINQQQYLVAPDLQPNDGYY